MIVSGTIAKHKGTSPVVTPSYFWNFAVPFLLVILGGEVLKQTYSVLSGQRLYREQWEQLWLVVSITGNEVYYNSLWQWVWTIKLLNSLCIFRERSQWVHYRWSYVQDCTTTVLFFVTYVFKEYVNSLTGFRLSGHFLACILASAVLVNEAYNAKRYRGLSCLPKVVGVMVAYHWVSLFCTAFIYHTFLECVSGAVAALAISLKVYFR
jgi:hypothetical protein